jgi:hypothetical protein
MSAGEITQAPPGAVIDQLEFQILVGNHRAWPTHLTDAQVMPRGDKYAIAYLEGHGLAIVSAQSGAIYIITLMDLIHLAQDAGIEKDAPVIIVPGEEAHRG